MDRKSADWRQFVKKQKKIILGRHDGRYNNIDVVQQQLQETGNLSDYQKYKIETVSQYQRRCLLKIEKGTYGCCDVCAGEIPIKRLELVPAALTCVACDSQKEA